MKPTDKSKEALLGTIFSLGSSDVAEIISLAGFDWVLIDMEHSTLSLDAVQSALQAAGEKIIKIVRVPGNDEIWIKRVLDTGCDGILVPMVKSAGEAELAVASARYPVTGNRSVGVTRAHGYGSDFAGYVERANREIIVMIQVEHIEAVNNIDSILAVKGIDAVFIGPYDLSSSMGLMGQTDHPDVKAAIEIVKNKCRKAGLPWGIFGASPEAVAGHKQDGCRYLLCGIDSAVLMNSYSEMVKKLKKLY
jgi:2-dehydro-3-deoxyglucarate aldolase/4-hydroxy-2-oxoheptanedioate aldolase